MASEMTLEIPADAAYGVTARLFVVAAARDLGVSEEITEDLRLAASELVANAVEAGRPGPIRLALRGDPGTVRLEVSGIGEVVDASPISRRALLESLFDATDLTEEDRVSISVPTEAGAEGVAPSPIG
jgi:anti-sigma regulatory factor (Ser/Thr protein kinase)